EAARRGLSGMATRAICPQELRAFRRVVGGRERLGSGRSGKENQSSVEPREVHCRDRPPETAKPDRRTLYTLAPSGARRAFCPAHPSGSIGSSGPSSIPALPAPPRARPERRRRKALMK